MAAPPSAASQAWTEETQVKEGDDKKPITRIVRHFVFSVSLLFFFIFTTEIYVKIANELLKTAQPLIIVSDILFSIV